MSSPRRVLITGGVRSGKSSHAEALCAASSRVEYVATSQADPQDADWQQRVRLHRERRPAHWCTTETTDLVGVLAGDEDAEVLIDCLGVWLTRLMDQLGCWDDPSGSMQPLHRRTDELAAAVRSTRRRVVLVTNEVGWGVVPPSRAGRMFADELGRLNAAVAAECDQVILCVAGIPVTVKPARR